MTHNKRLLR